VAGLSPADAATSPAGGKGRGVGSVGSELGRGEGLAKARKGGWVLNTDATAADPGQRGGEPRVAGVSPAAATTSTAGGEGGGGGGGSVGLELGKGEGLAKARKGAGC